MKKTLLAVVAVLLLGTGAAHADTLPKQMLGNWCEEDHPVPSGQIFERGVCKEGDGVQYKIKSTGYAERTTADHACTV